jgi:hypothetical protein
MVLDLFNNPFQMRNLNGEYVETSSHEIFVQRILSQHFRSQTEENDDKSVRTASVRAGNVGYFKNERALTHLNGTFGYVHPGASDIVRIP